MYRGPGMICNIGTCTPAHSQKSGCGFIKRFLSFCRVKRTGA